jgi:hypothetical protein
MTPQIIHQITGPRSNGLTQKCLDSWQILAYYDFEIKIWNDESLKIFIGQYYPFAQAAFINARNHGEAADIARYLIVYHFGGYYVDWDVQLIDLNKFFTIVEEYTNGFLIQDQFNQTIASEAFSASKQELFLLGLVENIVSIYENNFRDSMSTPHYSGPFRMRDYYYFTKKDSKQALIPVKDVFLYDYSEIRQMPPRNHSTAMIHYWIHSWFTNQ